MHQDFRDSVSAGLQQRKLPLDNRQQQQDNGTREFQPPVSGLQQGDGADIVHTLAASLERSRLRGELPRAPRRPTLWRAK